MQEHIESYAIQRLTNASWLPLDRIYFQSRKIISSQLYQACTPEICTKTSESKMWYWMTWIISYLEFYCLENKSLNLFAHSMILCTLWLDSVVYRLLNYLTFLSHVLPYEMTTKSSYCLFSAKSSVFIYGTIESSLCLISCSKTV